MDYINYLVLPWLAAVLLRLESETVNLRMRNVEDWSSQPPARRVLARSHDPWYTSLVGVREGVLCLQRIMINLNNVKFMVMPWLARESLLLESEMANLRMRKVEDKSSQPPAKKVLARCHDPW